MRFVLPPLPKNSVEGATYDAAGGYWAYPCAAQLNASFSFTGLPEGTPPLQISNDDLNFGQVNALSDKCVGAIIEGNTSGYWILGLAFLKNYYTVRTFFLIRGKAGRCAAGMKIADHHGISSPAGLRCWKLSNRIRHSYVLDRTASIESSSTHDIDDFETQARPDDFTLF